MMLQIAHFVLLFTVAIGLVAIYIVFNLYREYKLTYLRSYLYILIGFNVISLAHSVETFLKLTTSNNTLNIGFALYYTISPVALSCIRIFLAYHFIYFLWGIAEKNWPGLFKKLCWGLASVYLIANLVYYIEPEYLARLPEVLYTSVHFVFFTLLSFGLIWIFYSSVNIKNRDRKLAIIVLTTVLFVFNAALFLTRISLNAGWIELNTQMTGISLVMLLFNSGNMIFFRKFFTEIHINYHSISINSLDDLVLKFGVTEREKEIIVLTCKGKTNKEIAEELFLSHVTVRDHLSNVYRKTQTKNRFELLKLFHS